MNRTECNKRFQAIAKLNGLEFRNKGYIGWDDSVYYSEKIVIAFTPTLYIEVCFHRRYSKLSVYYPGNILMHTQHSYKDGIKEVTNVIAEQLSNNIKHGTETVR